jgi:hypothetical protein
MAFTDAGRQRIDDCLLIVLDSLPEREREIRSFQDAVVQANDTDEVLRLLQIFEVSISADLHPNLLAEIRETIAFLRATL